ncbi:MAG TPA: sigma-70 family RNA polymerase sigma factor [Candidatus Polarisedimenticolia bacterium]|nr:sigma-70 family RNA polymerase sigma factor [Candidatus Polarisedimenticolia bacterium]
MTKATEPTDESLLARMIAGDEEAFTLLYRRRQPAIYRFALRVGGNAALAEDVAQEVFMALIRDAGRFDAARGTLAGFLYGIARNHLRKRWEQDQRVVPLANDPDSLPMLQRHVSGSVWASDELVAHDAAERLRQAIATLPENYREVVALCELEEMSYEEASAALDCPVGTVRSRLHRARALLMEKLREGHGTRHVPAVGE